MHILQFSCKVYILLVYYTGQNTKENSLVNRERISFCPYFFSSNYYAVNNFLIFLTFCFYLISEKLTNWWQTDKPTKRTVWRVRALFREIQVIFILILVYIFRILVCIKRLYSFLSKHKWAFKFFGLCIKVS